MRRKHKKRWLFTGLSAILLLVGFLLLLHFPQVLIAKQLTHGRFTVYSSVPLEEPALWEAALDSVANLLDSSHWSTPDQKFQIFLAKNTAYESLLGLVGWDKPFAFAFLNREIFLAEPLIKDGLFTRNDSDYEKRALIQLITHESVHVQQDLRGVKRGSQPWVNEGYAEYVSHLPIRERPGYQLAEVVREVEANRGEFWLRSDYGYWDIWEYKYYRVLVEYLIMEKGINIEAIVARQRDWPPDVLFEEIKAKYALQ